MKVLLCKLEALNQNLNIYIINITHLILGTTIKTTKCVYDFSPSPLPKKYQRLSYGRKPRKSCHTGTIFSDDAASSDDESSSDWEVPKFREKLKTKDAKKLRKERMTKRSFKIESYSGDTDL